MTISTGVITTDPLRDLPVGARLSIETLTFVPLIGGQESAPPWAHFNGTLLKLGFKDAESFRIIGSGVVVAPTIAVAAKHVVEPEIPALMDGTSTGYAVAVTPWGLDIWQPDQITVLHHADLVIIALRRASALPPDNTLRQVAISTRVPAVGEVVMITGFRAGASVFPADQPVFDGQIHAASGLVSEHYFQGRDRAMLPWPSIEVSVDAVGGMSGGPAFDESGRLIGVLCSSLSSSDGSGPSYVSLIRPVLDEHFNVPILGVSSSLRNVAQRIGSIF